MSAPSIKTSVNGVGMTFGVGDITISGVSIETAEIDITAQIDATATDQEGLVAAWAIGGKQGTVNIAGYQTGDLPAFGDEFTINIGGVNETVCVTGVKPSRSNRDFGKVTITGKFYEGVS